MRRTADRLFGDDYQWSILGAGRNQMPLATIGAAMGSHVRVGLEDSLWIGPASWRRPTPQQVTRIRTILEALNFESPPPTRRGEMLHLKGRENVGFEPISILVAPDSFKGTFTASQVAGHIAAGIRSAGAAAREQAPVADGGEGTTEALARGLDARPVLVTTVGPWGEPLEAAVELTADGTAVVELAVASGLNLPSAGGRDPLTASTYGTGVMIAEPPRRRADARRDVHGHLGRREGALEAVRGHQDAHRLRTRRCPGP